MPIRAEELVSVAAVHGVDLLQAARMRGNPGSHNVEWRQFAEGRRSPILVEQSGRGARGAATRSITRPEWSIAELAQAAQGVPMLMFRAACYAFAGDRSCYWELQRGLYAEGLSLGASQMWPAHCTDLHGIEAPYLDHLSCLVLDEDFAPNAFQVCPELYAVYMRTRQKIWDKQLRERFGQLKMRWLSWLGEAATRMQPRLADESWTAG